jgi:hypothetical protein
VRLRSHFMQHAAGKTRIWQMPMHRRYPER